jgi:hypothetical protein
MKVTDQAFFQAKGAVGICQAFKGELEKNGKLSTRGEPTIDAFVEAINKKLADGNSQADAPKKDWLATN